MLLGVSASTPGTGQGLCLHWLLSSVKGLCGMTVGGKWLDMVTVIEDTMSRSNKYPGCLQNLKIGTSVYIAKDRFNLQNSNYELFLNVDPQEVS